jgi:hypothetical protein
MIKKFLKLLFLLSLIDIYGQWEINEIDLLKINSNLWVGKPSFPDADNGYVLAGEITNVNSTIVFKTTNSNTVIVSA